MGPWAIFAIVASIFAGGASYVQAKKAKKLAKKLGETQKGLLVNKESNVGAIPVIYGQRRVGGIRVFISSDGREVVPGDPDYSALVTQYYSDYDANTDIYAGLTTTPTNKYLYMAIVLCEGRVENITDIHLDDIPVTDPKWQGKVVTQIFTGADDQVAAPILRESNERWSTDHRLRGVAYIACRFEYDEDVFNGIPDVTAVVTGRKIYDPRAVGQSQVDPSTWTYSNNPALCLLDYLTNERFGKGLSYSVIDSAAFIEAANDCDQSVTMYDGGGSGKLFESNIVIDTAESIFDNVNQFLIAMRGFLPYSQGLYQLRIDKSRATVMDFNINNIIGGMTVKGESKEDKFNRVTVKFANPENNWQDDIAIWPPAGSALESQYLSEDGGTFLYDEIELDGITNYYQARDLARIFLMRSRNALRCAFQCTSDALQLAVGDVVTVTYATPGFVAKPFQVDEIAINTDGSCALSLLEYDSTIYTWEVGTVQQQYPDTFLPNPYIIGVVTGISVAETITINTDGSVVVDADITWTAPTDSNIVSFEIQAKRAGDADSTYRSFSAPGNSYRFFNIPAGLSYTIRIRCINYLGIHGEWVTQTYLLDGKSDNPITPTSLAAVAGIKSVKLTWVNPVQKDIGLVLVYRNTVNSSATAVKVGSVYGEAFTDNGLADSTLYYYWVKSVDTTGNISSFSSPTSVTTLVGVSGPTGDTGPRNALVYFFYNIATATAPTAPTTAQISYNFSTSTPTISTTNWSASFNPAALSNADGAVNKFWAVRVTFQESTFGGAYSETIVGPFVWNNFDGLVTFTNLAQGRDVDGSISTTLIDGGAITADTLTVNSIRSNTSKSFGTGFVYELGTSTQISGYQGAGLFRTSVTSGFGVGALANATDSFAVGAQQAGNNATSYAGFFANSTALGGTSHRTSFVACSNTRAGFFQDAGRNAALCNGTYSMQTLGDVYVDGSIVATGTITPFTGAHDGLMSDIDDPEIGDILLDSAILARNGISDTLALMVLSTAANQPAIGIFRCYTSYVPSAISITVSVPETAPGIPEYQNIVNPIHAALLVDRNTVSVNSVGEGQINVCGEAGNIQAGDLIVTSSILAGKGMRQSDDIIRSKTVAKARESVTFASASEVKQIACIYLCG